MPWFSAVLQIVENPKETIAWVRETSSFMDNRASLVNREAHDYLQKITLDDRFAHVWSVFEKYGFTPQTIVDALFSFPTWIAKYNQGMAKHGDHTLAVSEADTAVGETVGAGDDLHLGRAFHSDNNEYMRMFTLFGSWFNAYFQRVYKSTKGGKEFLNVDAARSIIITPFIVAMMAAAIRMEGPDDDEEWYEWAALQYLGFMAGTVPLLRDIAGAFDGFAPKTVWSAGGEAPARLVNEVKAYIGGKQTVLKTVSDVSKVVATVVPVPGAGSVTRAMDYTDSYNRGREGGTWNAYQALVKGPTRK